MEYGDFEWDDEKAASNIAKHGVSFEAAATAMTDPYAVDFADSLEPENICTLAASPDGRILYVVSTVVFARIRIISARLATRHERDSMKDPTEPSTEALAEMPEIDEQRFRRIPGRGHHVHRRLGETITIDDDVWDYFGSVEAIHDALRRLMTDKK
jgi:uncharacterized DUF497 family protein